MLIKLRALFCLLAAFYSAASFAKFRIVTSTEDLASIATVIGGDKAEAISIAKGTQDPHFIEAKPSHMVKLSRADVVFSIGLSLEVGWLPLLLRGARQPKILPGQPGYVEVSQAITAIEVVSNADRSEGDVHPFGNPHIMADPERGRAVAALIGKKMAELDAENAATYTANAAKLDATLKEKIAKWKERLKKAKGLKVLGYHKTFNYFIEFFGLKQSGYIEPKPGIPPTAQHILSTIETAKREKVGLILLENYFDTKAAKTISAQTGAKLVILPAYTGGDEKSATYLDWLEQLVAGVEKELK